MSNADRQPARTRIKICGVRDVQTALHAAACGADAIGLMRFEQSPRCVDAAAALRIACALPSFVEPVWVFRDAAIAQPPPGTIQLHGSEDADFVARLRSVLPRPGRIIRAIACERDSVLAWNSNDQIDAVLVEGTRPGEGVAFDHAELAQFRPLITKPLILAGGLDASNVGPAIAAVRPYAVDVSSGVESARGVKDAAMIEAFCEAVRAADMHARATGR